VRVAIEKFPHGLLVAPFVRGGNRRGLHVQPARLAGDGVLDALIEYEALPDEFVGPGRPDCACLGRVVLVSVLPHARRRLRDDRVKDDHVVPATDNILRHAGAAAVTCRRRALVKASHLWCWRDAPSRHVSFSLCSWVVHEFDEDDPCGAKMCRLYSATRVECSRNEESHDDVRSPRHLLGIILLRCHHAAVGHRDIVRSRLDDGAAGRRHHRDGSQSLGETAS
jgi:hypothetical protein